MVTAIIVCFVTILSFSSLKYCKKRFDVLELIILFLFSSCICQTIFYKIFSAYDRLVIVESFYASFSVKLHFGMMLPSLLIWVMFVLKSKTELLTKLIVSFSWILFNVIGEKIYLLVGVLESKTPSWYPSIDLFFGMLIIPGTLFFLEKMNDVLRKDHVIQ
ncbi:hypothetical protein ACJROX_01360 [Pseudalkalibacillus sp. A8]|uniref:hypothetical protein n=1 Tax=Pseudalkalibacillus sp. A8 TaxID=3382641 RepID=UPI0038B67C02